MDEGEAVRGGKWGPARGMEVCACGRRGDIGRATLERGTGFCENGRGRDHLLATDVVDGLCSS